MDIGEGKEKGKQRIMAIRSKEIIFAKHFLQAYFE